ncbi:DEAD/DEAH box helicase [Rossellomorea sp. H39__3]
MLSVKMIISRADEFTIQNILTSQFIKLMQSLDSKYFKTSEQKKLIFLTYEEHHFIESVFLRSILIDLLREEEVNVISDTLGFLRSDLTCPYEYLKNKKFIKNSEEERILYYFFNLIPPSHEKENIQNSNDIIHERTINPNYPLFKHQKEAIKSLKEKLQRYPHRVLLHMPTGSGKTRTSMSLICDYLRENEGFLVVWLASTEELCSQAFEEFKKAWSFLGDRKIEIGKLWGNAKIEDLFTMNEGIIIAGFQKLTAMINTKESQKKLSMISNRICLVVVDEAHQSIAERYQSVIEILVNSNSSTRLLGLSATPGRTWNDVNEDKRLSDFYNNNKVNLKIKGYNNPVNFLVDNGYMSSVHYKNLNYASGEDLKEYLTLYTEGSKDFSKEVLTLLGKDSDRNLVIVNEVIRLTNEHNRILVFAPSVESSNIIARVLRIQGFHIDSLTSRTDSETRESIIKEFKKNDEKIKIIINYGVLTTGFDAPNTSAALIARPTLSLVLYSQMVGRAIRGIKAGGNDRAEIITVVDTELPGFRSVADSFYNWEDVWNENS